MVQLPLKLVHESTHTRENFVISDANREAFSWMEQWPHWPAHCLIVYGEPGCGKTHLAQIWREKTSAKYPDKELFLANLAEGACYVLENIERIRSESALLHCFNQVKEQGGYLLLTAGCPPVKLPFTLPDLTSRLQGVPSVAVHAPDEGLLKTLLIKSFSDKQLKVTSEVIDYIIPRIERSFEAVRELALRLDARALEEHRNITVKLVREVLEEGKAG